jgi:agmatine deiminase
VSAAAPPANLGYRWPAEWEPHAATWLAWPHNVETWPGRLPRAVEAFAAIVAALHAHETVELLVADAAMEESARRCLAEGGVDTDRGVRFRHVPTNDAWIRDYGPIFLVRDGGPRAERRALVDFGFDAWGGKYSPWDLDDAVPSRMSKRLGLRRFEAGFVLEGGSIDGNGRGTILTTESCLLNGNRGEGRDRETMERRLCAWLGATHVLWLADGIAGDDTDGHVDDVARFVDPSTVVAAVEEDAADPNFAPLAENLRRLRGMRDQDGKPITLVPLPMPPALEIDGLRCPASYANFYLGNGVALVPTFDADEDARALAILRELLPGREIIGVPCAELVRGLGSVHCLSQQEPA